MFVPMARNDRVVQFVKLISIVADSFGSGVLFGAAVFLLLPESFHMVGSAAQWGTAILLGWFLGVLIDHFSVIAFSRRTISSAGGGAATEQDRDNAGDMQSPPVDLEADDKRVDSSRSLRPRHSLACSILVGDFFHNFSDGVVIAAAFKGCSHSFAWKIAAVTVLHEIPQEIADFIILVNEVGMTALLASVANFSCSMSTLLGAVITYASSMDAKMQGLFLAFGAGIFVFVAATELGPIVSRIDGAKPALASLQRSLSFVIGAAIIGLILLDHEHCELADEGSDPHAGHGH
jgi:zinc transporter ZupT